MAVTPEEVRRIAALARLELADDEIDGLVRDLGEILAHVDTLEGVEPRDGRGDAAYSGGRAHLRGDQQGADPLAEPPASFAPGFEGGYFTVPRLESHGDSGAR